MSEPPVMRYRLTLVIEGNTIDDVESELLSQVRGGFLLDSNHYTRDEWQVVGGQVTSTMEHRNPEMTAERYEAELDAWWAAEKAARRSLR